MTMATFPLSNSSSYLINSYTSSPSSSVVSPSHFFPLLSSHSRRFSRLFVSSTGISDAPQQHLIVDKSALVVNEAVSEDELWAAANLRIRTFNKFKEDSFGVEDHKKYLIEREFEALKERVAGKREGFKKNFSGWQLPSDIILLQAVNSGEDGLSSIFSDDEGCKVVVGSLDLNQCLRLPDEMTGMRPQGIGADFARAYLSNVCVAKELHRNGLGYALVSKAKSVAETWGITDLYVHVAADNESAKQLYLKSGFIHESDEPAWQARFLNRPRRLILWFGLPNPYDL